MGRHHPLGGRGRSAGHQDLDHRIRCQRVKGGIHIRPHSAPQQIVKRRHAGPPMGAAGDDLDALERLQRQRRAILRRIHRIGHSGPDQPDRMAQPPMRPVDQGILLGHRHRGNARILPGQRQKPVIHPVARQDQDRRIRVQPPRQKRPGQRPHLLQSAPIALLAPPGAAALRQKHPLRCLDCPAVQPVARAPRHRPHRMARTIQTGSVRAGLQRDLMRPVFRQFHHATPLPRRAGSPPAPAAPPPGPPRSPRPASALHAPPLPPWPRQKGCARPAWAATHRPAGHWAPGPV